MEATVCKFKSPLFNLVSGVKAVEYLFNIVEKVENLIDDVFVAAEVTVDVVVECAKEEIEQSLQPVNEIIEEFNNNFKSVQIPFKIKFAKRPSYEEESKRLLKAKLKRFIKPLFKEWVTPVIISLVPGFVKNHSQKERLSSVKKLKPQY